MTTLPLNILREDYWRTLLRPYTWYQARINIRRIGKDQRARKHLLYMAGFLLVPLFWLPVLLLLGLAVVAAFAVGGAEMAASPVGLLIGVPVGLAAGALIREQRRREAIAKIPQAFSPEQL